MTERDILEYLKLVDRRLFIMMHSGRSWKPEYAAELETIDNQLAEFRKMIDKEMQKGVKERWCAQR